MNIIADESKLRSDAGASLLINKIKELNLDTDAILYYNFPFYKGETKNDLIQAHVLFISKLFGVIAFRCITDIRDFTSKEKIEIDSLDSHIFAKINKCESLRLGRRELKISITPIIFSNEDKIINEIQIIDSNNIKSHIEKNKKTVLNNEEYRDLIATIEGTSRLRQKKERNIDFNSTLLTKGRALSLIQEEQTVFDLEQKRAALNIIDSPQRIRGLAGSGKTIILTMKAALFHLQNPDSMILYTYFTKALYGQIKYLIEKYYRDFSDNMEPDWSKIEILHGWGGVSLKGVYYQTCMDNNITPISFNEAMFKNSKDPFDYICMELIKKNLNLRYDLTLIDEGQDFPKHFYQLSYKITKNRRLVWAYDDFQNIFDVEIQDEKDTFGKDSSEKPIVDFSTKENQLQDIVLHKCYRNPRNALIAAFSLGLGIYNDPVLQRLENNQHWQDLGFLVETGDSSENSQMIICRPEENSPINTNKDTKPSISIQKFYKFNDECDFIVNCIVNDIKDERLRPDDICVISLDQKNMKQYFVRIQYLLERRGLNVFNLLNVSNSNTYFSIENHITLSSINKAKGNEVGMVYITGVDSIFTNKNYIINRNKLFTAITRTKGWVMLTGMGDEMNSCINELQKLKDNDYKFVFTQPNKENTKTILRRMSEQQSLLNQIESLIEKTGLPFEEVIKLLNRSK
ncbi:ATP-dependent RecD-like DNA helicase [termite gut metagenome]|uniref:ATP-dependent RecD-like DNA helicase n=1 Tax=termite gut metagenome TaxID=433724 RepID=A0A5J4RZA6_9ZZZZ